MGAFIEIIAEGFKKFGGEIIGGILFAVVLGLFPSLRKLFRRKDDSAEEVKEELAKLKSILNDSLKKDSSEEELQKQLDVLKQEEEQLAHLKGVLQRNDEALRQAETQTAEEARRKEDIQRQLEEQRREEEWVKAEIQRKQEELRQAEEKRKEEARLKAELERQREEKRREEERIRAEIQRKQEALRQAEARKAEEARQREELQRQLEAMKGASKVPSSKVPSSNDGGNKYRFAILGVIFVTALFAFVGMWKLVHSNDTKPIKPQPIKGTPAKAGTFTFSVRAVYGSQSTEKSFTVNIAQGIIGINSTSGGCQAGLSVFSLLLLAIFLKKH